MILAWELARMFLILIVVDNAVDLVILGSESFSRRALDIKTAVLGPDALPITYTLHHLADHAVRGGRSGEAGAHLRRALDIEARELGGDSKRVAKTLHKVGWCAWEAGRPEEAEEALRRALAVEEESGPGPKNGRWVKTTLLYLGLCSKTAGRLGDMMSFFERFLEMEIDAFGPGHRRTADALHTVGWLVLEAGQVLKAEEYLGRVYSHEKFEAMAAEGPRVGVTLRSLGVQVRNEGRLEDAEAYLRLALGIMEANLREDDRDRQSIARLLDELSVCAREAGRLKGEEELLARALAMLATAVALTQGRAHPEQPAGAACLHPEGG